MWIYWIVEGLLIAHLSWAHEINNSTPTRKKCRNIIWDHKSDIIFNFISWEDIHNALHRKRSTAPGQDKITYHILQKLPNTAIHFLSNLYTASLYLGYVPKRWKHAHILLFPKPDKDQTNPNNYRPISLTCTISKLLEK